MRKLSNANNTKIAEHSGLAFLLESLFFGSSKSKEVGGHGSIDFIMDNRPIYYLHKGLPLNQDVNDASEWPSIIELSQKSVENQRVFIKVPYFT